MEHDQTTDLSRQVIGLAIEVHRHLGPGLLERVYEECLCFELQQARIPFAQQQKIPLKYKNADLNCGYLIDIVIDEHLIIEVKAVAHIEPVHEAQLLTYMRLGGYPLGLLLNFNAAMLKDGIRRRRI